MNPFQRLLALLAAEDASGGGTGDAPPPAQDAEKKDAGADKDAGAKKGDEKPPEKKDEKSSDAKAPTKKSTLAAAEEKGEKDGKDAGEGKPDNAKATSEFLASLKLPDGVEVDKGVLEKFAPVALKLGLKPEGASELAAFYAEVQTEAGKAQAAAWEKQGQDWYGQLENDPEYGGKNLAESNAALQRFVMKYGGRELAQELEKYGVANMPALAKALAKAGRALVTEDKSRVEKAPSTKPKNTELERLNKRYPTLKLGETQEQE